ncbi:MAG TPA: hypothetical protein VKV02_09585, partial [Acidobacteriaceae bacterium]|nr:hypothetical protein [Acidobacteriaceae bacterium]
MQRLFWLRLGCGVLAAGLIGGAARAATWFPLGPFGGDARSLAADPADPHHVFLGTATGWIYDSHDGGVTWNRVSQIARRNDLVIDHIVADTQNPRRLLVGAYTVDHLDGGIFISENYGKDWYSQAEMRGQSVRSLARSSSDPKELIAGTLRGVFRSMDNGVHWKQISPADSTEIKEVQSVAIDPSDPNVIYAGTWHLPWKTTDGGATWANIKTGIIDDSDVFSIIVDPKDPKVVYASACSGIYKSADAGEKFVKVEGIPSAARRTRTLEQDPEDLKVVFAGTTEGLYRTQDAGAKWERLTPADMIVNDVYVDPSDSHHVLLATDRGGVFRSEDGGSSFEISNEGFSARQVTAYATDAQNKGTVYVGVVNDKTTGGVFQSTDGGVKWRQQSDGLGGRDVFSLISLADGTLLAGTGHGIFRLQDGTWTDSSGLEGASARAKVASQGTTPVILSAPTRLSSPPVKHGPVRPAKHKPAPAAERTGAKRRVPATGRRPNLRRTASGTQKNRLRLVAVKGKPQTQRAQTQPKHPAAPAPSASAETAKPGSTPQRLDTVVYTLARSGDVLFAGGSTGLLRSVDAGQHWAAVDALVMPDVHYLAVLNPASSGAAGAEIAAPMLLAGSLQRLALSPDGGATWDTVALPADLTQIGGAAIDGDKNLWVGGREGVWMSTDYGATWKTLRNLFLTEVDSIYFDPAEKRVLVTASNSPVAFSVSGPDHKVSYWDTGWKLRFVRPV